MLVCDWLAIGDATLQMKNPKMQKKPVETYGGDQQKEDTTVMTLVMLAAASFHLG